MSHPVLKNTEIETLRTTGLTTAKCLLELWKEDHCGNEDQFKLMCLLMRAHGLLQTIKSDPMAGSGSDPVQPLIWSAMHRQANGIQKLDFLIPCMLSGEGQVNIEVGYTFYFDFKGFLPQEVFHCFISLVIKKCPDPPPECWASACIMYCLKGYDWNVQLQSEKHRLKVVAR